MNPFPFPILTDENIHPHVVTYLRKSKYNVLDVKEQQWHGLPDEEVLRRAYEEGRVVITQDRDFGMLAIAAQQPLTGVIYLRPAEINPDKTIQNLSHFFKADLSLIPPFIVVLQGSKVRIRHLGSDEA